MLGSFPRCFRQAHKYRIIWCIKSVKKLDPQSQPTIHSQRCLLWWLLNLSFYKYIYLCVYVCLCVGNILAIPLICLLVLFSSWSNLAVTCKSLRSTATVCRIPWELFVRGGLCQCSVRIIPVGPWCMLCLLLLYGSVVHPMCRLCYIRTLWCCSVWRPRDVLRSLRSWPRGRLQLAHPRLCVFCLCILVPTRTWLQPFLACAATS